jgi:hypothetical protein
VGHPYRDERDALVERIDELRRELRDIDARRDEMKRSLDVMLKSLRARQAVRGLRVAWRVGLVVSALATIAIVVEVLKPRVYGPCRVDAAKTDCKTLSNVIDVWRMEGGTSCPTIETLKAEGALRRDQDTTDPWGNPYVIVCSSDEDGVMSAGPDGRWCTGDDIWEREARFMNQPPSTWRAMTMRWICEVPS